MKRLTMGIVFAALIVSMPRLVLAFLIGDGIGVPANVEAAILATTGIGAGLVLTLGNALIADTLARTYHRRSALWFVELVAWFLFLAGAVVLVAPTLVAGLERSDLIGVLDTDGARWAWSVTAVLLVELLTAAALAAGVLAEEEQPVQAKPAGAGGWGLIAGALAQRIAAPPVALEPVPASAEASTPATPTRRPQRAATKPTKRGGKWDAMNAVVEFYEENPGASLAEAAGAVGRAKSTVSGYVEELVDAGRLHRNGNGVEVVA